MDRIDEAILEQLQTDGRATNKALAAAVGLAPSSTLARVRDLEQRNVISGYHAAVDPAAVGRQLQAVVFVRLHPKNDQVVANFVDRVWEIPQTVGLFLVSGSEDVIVHLAVANTTELRETVLNSISNLPGVTDERTALVFEHRTKRVISPSR
jgi:DNA-binding Lrp family transcriptional regulator